MKRDKTIRVGTSLSALDEGSLAAVVGGGPQPDPWVGPALLYNPEPQPWRTYGLFADFARLARSARG